ncbi:glycoside hydrolase family 13 protein [Saccharothrix coeruleofusca]|uniref:Alpha-glucosidase n=1 Tax=Saccharothrix coeruleofusca TaxID=33919 RepID=A0A918ALN2_9PSEU|nr:glycoside hydrolase family 13 protein [Saccharothrix coeruleofusca]MBP2334134.1 alpha-glucosidase [Saccharothrix coeruleofusca]GGP43228.1 alpha-glucosidase [Saccharothrix coeruleofusca]
MSQDWWRDAVIYQVYVRSFADSDGDGVGDLPGIRSRLPHLAGLGVDALWITPFYASPMADGGYDVADYRAVDPAFGTLADASALIADAHALGLRVIVDLVPNHTSDRHRWFQRALAARPGSPERARYHFRDGRGELPPNDWESVFGGPAWTRVPDGQWYLHLFAPEQPDLNWDNPEVREEFLDVLRFWLDLGVDGFRVDVAHGMVKADGLPDVGRPDHIALLGTEALPFFDQDGVHEIYRDWRKVLDSYDGPRVGVAEAWTPSPERTALYLRPDELHQAFNFHYLTTDWDPARLRGVIDDSLAASALVGAPTTWVLSNHDVRRHVTRYGSVARARAAALLMLALPGSAYLYQGEELGLPEVLDLPDEVLQDPVWERSGHTDRGRDGCRVPIPWTTDGPSFGFGDGGSWLPQPADWGALSVAAQQGDPDSVLELYRSALRVRREHPDLGAGSGVRWLDAPEGVLAFERGRFACAVNFGPEPVRLPLGGEVLLASGPVTTEGGDALVRADTTVWWQRP